MYRAFELSNILQAIDYSVPKTTRESLSSVEAGLLKEEIKSLLKSINGVVVAHYYTDAEIQILAEETGGYVSDSLDMARFGSNSSAKTLIVAGVRFMGETAKILNPEKTILMPSTKADCSLDLGCPPELFKNFCDDNPDRTVVVYANTSAAVKAQADWMVTSGSAVDVIQFLADRGEKLIWAPDRYLGDYVRYQTGADMLLWNGSCTVHEEFKASELKSLKKEMPDALVVAHPESQRSVLDLADYVGSTSGLIKIVCETEAKRVIVATDKGIFHKMKMLAPTKTLIPAPTSGESATCKSCAQCPWMAMNGLKNLRDCMINPGHEIFVADSVSLLAKRPIKRLLEFADNRGDQIYGNNDA